MFFHFRQNNSGGGFSGPAKNVWIEADDGEDANDRAERVGLYFNGTDDGTDCDCCGDRWWPMDSYSAGTEVPHYYSWPLEVDGDGFKYADTFLWELSVPQGIVVYKDGRVIPAHPYKVPYESLKTPPKPVETTNEEDDYGCECC